MTIHRGKRLLGGVTGNAGGIDYYNCYFDNQLCSAAYSAGCHFDSLSPFDPAYCGGKTTQVLRSDKMPGVLGNAFQKDVNWVNKGYPTLAVMTYGQEDENWSEWFEDEAMGDNIDQEIFNSLIPAELQNKDLTQDISRLEFCAVAVQLYEQMGGKQLNAADLTTPFTDTGADVVAKAYALGITNGVAPDKFAPYTDISREQLATMLTRVYKALSLPGWTLATDDQYHLDYSGTKIFDDDGDISPYAKPSVYFMVKNEVIKGTSPTTFSPRNVTPAQEAIGYANASREQAPDHGGADVPEAVTPHLPNRAGAAPLIPHQGGCLPAGGVGPPVVRTLQALPLDQPRGAAPRCPRPGQGRETTPQG